MDCTPPMEWYEPHAEEPEEWFHISEYQVHYAQEHLMALIEAIYKTGSIEDIERNIEELASYLKVTFEVQKPKIQKQGEDRMMYELIGYQRAMIDSMKGDVK